MMMVTNNTEIDEAKAIADAALDIIIAMSQCTESFRELTMDYCHKNLLEKMRDEISLYLSSGGIFNIEGYIRFNGRAYIQKINSFLTHVFKKINIQDNHDRIIADLKSYVASGKPEKELLYLENKNGCIEIFDEDYNRLTQEAVKIYATEYGIDKNATIHSDIVLHYLLKTLPKMIFIRTKPEGAFVRTLKQVFEDRIYNVSEGEYR